MLDRTEERIRRYERVAEELEGSASARARAVADKMRRGLKAEFDTEILRIRARVRALLKTDPEDAEMLKVVLEAADMAIDGKRKDSHIKRRTKVDSEASAEFKDAKEEVDAGILMSESIIDYGIRNDEEYLLITALSNAIKEFILIIGANSELTKHGKEDMKERYNQYLLPLNKVRREYLDRTGKKHGEIVL